MTVPQKTPATFTDLAVIEKYAYVSRFCTMALGNFGLLPQQQQFLHVMTFESSGLFRFAEGSTVFHHVAQGCEGASAQRC